MTKFSLFLFMFFSIFPGRSFPLGPQTDSNALNCRVSDSIMNDLISHARNNQSLKALDAKIRAASASADAVKSLDPPQAGIEFSRTPLNSFPNPFANQMEYDYYIQQTIPFPGKLGAMAGAEEKRTEMFKADREARELDIIRNVKQLYYGLYLKDRQMEINREMRKLAENIVETAKKQYEVGIGKQPDILRAQTELISLVNDSILIVQQRRSIEGTLNSICDRSVEKRIAFIPEIFPVMPEYKLEVLLDLAYKNRPELKSMQAEIGMQQQARLAAGKEYLPDFMVKGTYMQMRQSNDEWGLMIGATVPVAPWSLTKASSGISRSDASIAESQNRIADMKNIIASDVNDALLKLESSKAQIILARETSIPQAEKTLESAMAAYKTGKMEFIMIIDIQRMLAAARLDYHAAVMTLLDSKSRLERAAGLNRDDIEKSSERGNR
jgi:outer membrane protein, heavy metal efflux system